MAAQSWAADFETTGPQDYAIDGYVRVYLWHARNLYTDDEALGYDVESFILFAQRHDVKVVWFHNLKFDGSFILNKVLRNGWERSPKQIPKHTTYDLLVTDTGQWMDMKLSFGDHVVTIKDSAKKFPGMSLEAIAREYGIEGKADLDVVKRRGPDYMPGPEEIERVKGDTRILKVAMRDLMDQGMTALTMASDAKRYYQSMWNSSFSSDYKARQAWRYAFPELTPEEDEFVRAAFKGGWTWVNPLHRFATLRQIFVYDVNSMYPDKMRNCVLPIGRPWHVKQPREGDLYVVHFDAIFELKPGHFPTIQAKHSFRNAEAEYLTSSHGEYMHLAMTNIDYELFHDQYDVVSEQNHDYYTFRGVRGLFDEYIDHWMAEKVAAKKAGDKVGEKRAKRFLNSLYGKTGENPKKLSKEPYLDEDGVTRWRTVETDGSAWYLPIAVFITSYARDQVIRTAQAFGDDFIYADTDSVHALNGPSHHDQVDIDHTALGKWDLESVSMEGRYLRPKAYIHRYEFELRNWRPLDIKKVSPLEIKLGGAPDSCKANITWENFKPGASFKGKLAGCQVEGGYLLKETTYNVNIHTEADYGIQC